MSRALRPGDSLPGCRAGINNAGALPLGSARLAAVRSQSSSEITRSAGATSAGSPQRVTALPRTCRSALSVRSRAARRFSPAERVSHDEVRRNIVLLRTGVGAGLQPRGSAQVSQDVTWLLMPAFWPIDWNLSKTAVLRFHSNAGQGRRRAQRTTPSPVRLSHLYPR